MKQKRFIATYCSIRNGQITHNGQLYYSSEPDSLDTFLKSAYKHMLVSYPKFFKMDTLSKLAFLGAELVFSKETPHENTAVVLSNRASSLDTDRKHQQSISDPKAYYPSPAVFVYTLPNICIGEISIRHSLYSENNFFILDAFNPDRLWTYAEALFQNKKCSEVLCGWVECDGSSYEVFMYLVSSSGSKEHSIKNIIALYNE